MAKGGLYKQAERWKSRRTRKQTNNSKQLCRIAVEKEAVAGQAKKTRSSKGATAVKVNKEVKRLPGAFVGAEQSCYQRDRSEQRLVA